jgi:hypothetical protein
MYTFALVVRVVSSVTHPEPVGRSADFQSAVSPICNRQGIEFWLARRICPCSAEWNSAIQQIGNLRYVTVFASLGTLPGFTGGPQDRIIAG